jgi:IS30 family transposase
MIRDWPQEIKERSRIGDWEGDTVYGAIGKGLLVTCVDRATRFLAASLLESRSANLTCQAVQKALQGFQVNSLSLDNGSEFADFKGMEQDLNTKVYFADRHAPWQRGSNENMNGLIRFFFPKGTNFHMVTEDMLRVYRKLCKPSLSDKIRTDKWRFFLWHKREKRASFASSLMNVGLKIWQACMTL